MSSKLTASLGWITLIAILAALWVLFGEDPRKEIGARGARLFPDLSAKLDKANRISFSQAGVSTTLVQKDTGWIIAERDNFPADNKKVNAFLSGLGQSERREPKTSNFENMRKLGLGDAALYVQVDATIGTLAKLAIGEEGTRRNGLALTYVLKENDSRAWVVSALAESGASPSFWMQKQVLDISTADISLMTIGGATIARDTAGVDMTLLDLTEAEVAKPSWQLMAPVRAIAALTAEDVAAIANPATPPLRTITITRKDGLTIDVELYKRAARDGNTEATWARINASFNSSFIAKTETGVDSGADSEPDSAAEPAAAATIIGDRDPEADAIAINTRTRGWLFQLSESDAKSLLQNRSDFLTAKDSNS